MNERKNLWDLVVIPLASPDPQIPTGIELKRYEGNMAPEPTAADFRVGDIVWQLEEPDEYEVLALHPYPGHPNSDQMTVRCLVAPEDGYAVVGEEFQAKCRRYNLKRRGEVGANQT